jgi:uncharacterized phage protein (TIGR01671 family)
MRSEMMNREILFRAKSIQTGRWISGYYFEDEDNKSYIGYMSKKRYIPDTRDWDIAEYYENNPTYNWVFVKEEVVSETVGQYTGLTDKNGTKIFEGDILQVNCHGDEIGRVCIYYKYAMYLCDAIYGDVGFDTLGMLNANYQLEVIGNVYDNPELLEK